MSGEMMQFPETIIHVKAMQDVCDIIAVLIRNDYTCMVKPVHKKFPCENNIDYFEISFTK